MDFNIEGPPTLILRFRNMVNDRQGIFGAEGGSFSVPVRLGLWSPAIIKV